MADEQVAKIFEQPPDAISFYSESAQVISTGNEVVLQFYDMIPGPPIAGKIQQVRSRLRATVTISPAHAANIGQLLLKHVDQPVKVQESSEGHEEE